MKAAECEHKLEGHFEISGTVYMGLVTDIKEKTEYSYKARYCTKCLNYIKEEENNE